ncbi:MAG TPA: TolC family protein [Kofleriaceae bacterium]|nr:TolC family protein [Kofleriaceae bacterium]
MDIRAAVVPTNLAPRLILAACAVAASPAPAHADAIGVSSLLTDPAQLARRLRDVDPVVASAQQRVIAASALTRQARVYPNPELSAALGGIVVGRGNTFNGSIGPTSLRDTGNVSLGVSELVELGKRAPRRAAADARSREVQEQAVAALGARLADGTEALGKLAYLTARRDVVSANLEAARKLLALEKVRLEHQDLAPVELERIALDTSALELQLRRADAEVASALAECNVLLQGSCTTEGLDQKTLDASATLPANLPEPTSAILNRPLRNASRMEASALEWDARLAEHRKIPDPTIGLSYTYDTYQYGGGVPNTFMLSVGIPLPFFDRGNHDAAAARANARAVEAEDQAAVREATGTVGALFARRDALGQTLSQLEQQSLPSSTRIIEQTRKAFDLGQSGLADLLLVERAHRDLLLDVLETRFELFEVRAQLREELGLDDEVARSVETP